MVTSMTEEDTERTACAGHIVGSTPHVSLKLKRCHLSARAAGFKAWPHLKIEHIVRSHSAALLCVASSLIHWIRPFCLSPTLPLQTFLHFYNCGYISLLTRAYADNFIKKDQKTKQNCLIDVSVSLPEHREDSNLHRETWSTGELLYYSSCSWSPALIWPHPQDDRKIFFYCYVWKHFCLNLSYSNS